MSIRRTIAAGAAAVLLLGAGNVAADPLDDAIALTHTDPAAAFQAFERLAAEGDPEAKNGMAAILEYGAEGIPADPARALRLQREAAAEGSDGARLNLSVRMLMNDARGDDAEAVAMLEQITHEGLKKVSSWPLGRAYLFGHGVDQDMARGVGMLEVAAETIPDNADTRFLLGRAYQNGWGVTPDAAKAFEHMDAAAHAGDARAQWHAGMMLLNGHGVTADPALARRYVHASAEEGYLEGMISMAVMLATGEGGPVDAPAAREWYKRAAVEANSAHALRGLGAMLMTGEGGPADLITGAGYLELAAASGDDLAPDLQARFADKIATVDAAAVQEIKARWLSEHGAPH